MTMKPWAPAPAALLLPAAFLLLAAQPAPDPAPAPPAPPAADTEAGRVVRGEPAPPSPWQIQLYFTLPIPPTVLEEDARKLPSDLTKKFWNEMQPWERDHQCGGVLIAGAAPRRGHPRGHPRGLWALTAAHCLVNGDDSITWTLAQSRVRLGNHDLTQGTEMAIERAVIHAGYSRANSKRDDIVLLRLVPDARTNRAIQAQAQPAAMGDALDAQASRLLATGWGITGERRNGAQRDVSQRPLRGSKTLLAAQLMPMPADACDRVPSLKGIAWAGTICAVGATAARQDTCQGDSGGPLMARNRLVGLVSTGEGCGRPGVPAIYTNVTAYQDWISLAMKRAPAGRLSRCRIGAPGRMDCTALS